MNWKEFKPTKKKIIFSFIITLAWWLLLFFINSSLRCPCIINRAGCIDYDYLSPLQGGGCHCGCTSIQMVIYQYLIAFLFPFIIAYFLMSLIEKKKR
jgi:hypothetical protein